MFGRASLPPVVLGAALSIVLVSGVALASSLVVTSADLTTLRKTYADVTTCTIEPAGDAYVSSDVPTTNHGAEAVLRVDAQSSATKRTLAVFDLGGCSPAIPAGAILHDADLRLTLSATVLETRTYALHRITGGGTRAALIGITSPRSPARQLHRRRWRR